MIGIYFLLGTNFSLADGKEQPKRLNQMQAYKVSVNKYVFKDGDRIRSFKLKFNLAHVSFAKVPEDASILINNWKTDLPNWTGEIDWSATVGAGE